MQCTSKTDKHVLRMVLCNCICTETYADTGNVCNLGLLVQTLRSSTVSEQNRPMILMKYLLVKNVKTKLLVSKVQGYMEMAV